MALRIPRLRINRMWLVLGGAIVMGLLAAWLSVGYLKNREKVIEDELTEKAKGGPTTAVVVATADVAKGGVVDGSIMALREVPSDLLYDDAVTEDNFAEVEGKTLIKSVLKGRPLRKSDVFDDRPRDIASELTPGHRALTVDIDELNSFSQMLRAGNFVDLYLMATNPGASASGTEIRPLLSKVKVIATGTTLQVPHEVEQMQAQGKAAANYSNITVDVTPDDAVRIVLAGQVGKIRAVLRKPDAEDTKMGELGTSELFDGVIKSKKKSRSVSYIVGGGGGGSTAPQAVNLSSIPGMPSIPGITAPAAGTPGMPSGVQPGVQASVPGMPASVNNSIPVAPTGMAPR